MTTPPESTPTQLDGIRQLGSESGEELDTVVVIRIVRGRYNDASLQAQCPGQVGDGRRRQRAGQADIDTGSRKPGLQCRFQHVA